MIGSIFFNIFYIFWTVFVCIICLPMIFLPKHIMLIVVGKLWARGISFFLRVFCNLKLNLVGKENIPPSPAIFAAKHQSALETIVFHLLINKPVFVLKKELLQIPFFGFYLKRMGMIAIDRDGGMKSLKFLLKQVSAKIKEGYSVIIFPEGTRTAPNQVVEYNPGVSAIYALNVAPIIPVALNTGCFWSKNSFFKKKGKYTIEFMPPIKQELDKKMFMAELKEKIEHKSKLMAI